MPIKYLRRDGLPLLLRHTGPTTLPENPPPGAIGPTILCLHDAGLQSSIFSDLLTSFGDESSTLSFDLPGHGRSGGLDALPSISQMADTANWVAGWCRIERPILVGHGMGALVALEWAGGPPGKRSEIGGLVLCGLGRTLEIDEDAIEAMRRVTHGKAPRPFDPSRVATGAGKEIMKRAYMEGIQTDPRATLGDLIACREWSQTFEANSRIECPIRFVDGQSQSDRARERSHEWAGTLSAASRPDSTSQHSQDSGTIERIEIEGASHYLPFEQPEALAAQIRIVAEAA